MSSLLKIKAKVLSLYRPWTGYSIALRAWPAAGDSAFWFLPSQFIQLFSVLQFSLYRSDVCESDFDLSFHWRSSGEDSNTYKIQKNAYLFWHRQHDANFQGNPLLQATKRHLNNSEMVENNEQWYERWTKLSFVVVVFSACRKNASSHSCFRFIFIFFFWGSLFFLFLLRINCGWVLIKLCLLLSYGIAGTCQIFLFWFLFSEILHYFHTVLYPQPNRPTRQTAR